MPSFKEMFSNPLIRTALSTLGNAFIAGGAPVQTPGGQRFANAMGEMSGNLMKAWELESLDEYRKMLIENSKKEGKLKELEFARQINKDKMDASDREQLVGLSKQVAGIEGLNPGQQSLANVMAQYPEQANKIFGSELYKSILSPVPERSNNEPFRVNLGDRVATGYFNKDTGETTTTNEFKVGPTPRNERQLTEYEKYTMDRYNRKDAQAEENRNAENEKTSRYARGLLQSTWLDVLAAGGPQKLSSEERNKLYSIDSKSLNNLDQLKYQYATGQLAFPSSGNGAAPVFNLGSEKATVNPSTGEFEPIGHSYAEAVSQYRKMSKRDLEKLTSGEYDENGFLPMIVTSRGERYYYDNSTGNLRLFNPGN